MKAGVKTIFCWPEMPALPPPGQPVLIRVATSPARPAARQELRMVLRQILTTWSQMLPAQLPLKDTPRGPVWLGQLGGHSLDINLSYAENTGWIGLIRASLIGVDAMPIQHFAEANDVALHYLGTSAMLAIQRATDPPTAFAVAWTGWEAQIKCLKQALHEWPPTPALGANSCAVQNLMLPDNLVVSVATTGL
jgi:phosphopantetheinyl transferase